MRRTLACFLFAFSSIQSLLLGDSFDPYHESCQYPVDISFFIADLKVDKIQGVQICEVQHGCISTFKGDRFNNGGKSLIAEHLLQALDSFHLPSWTHVNDLCDISVRETFKCSHNWKQFKNLKLLSKDGAFLQQASLPLQDPNDIYSYGGLVFSRFKRNGATNDFIEEFPSMIVIDRASTPYWVDKYKMTLLFKDDPLLERRKPRWALYQSEYTPGLANTIIEEIGGNMFVIKPRGQFLGIGVIIVAKEDLDATLKYILAKDVDSGITPDKSHQYWFLHKPDTFLVEKFIDAEPISVPHLDGNFYCPTIRMAFLLYYQNKEVNIEFLGGYYLFPEKAVSETGSLNERFKCICHDPFFAEIPLEDKREVEDQLTETLLTLYKKMLN